MKAVRVLSAHNREGGCLLGHWEREPQEENKLEGVVEWEPVYSADETLNDGQEAEDNPVLKRFISCRTRGELI